MLKLVNILLVFLVIVILSMPNTSGNNLYASVNTETHSCDDHEHDEHKDVSPSEQEDHSDCDHDHASHSDHNPDRENEDHDDHSAHDYDEHDHDEYGHEQAIELDHETEELIAIKTIKAQPGSVETIIRLTGKIGLNEDKVAHVVPYVSGIVQQVTKKLGDQVRAGETMAVIHSRELSEAKAEYLASVQRYQLARSVYERENKLWQQKISSEEEFIRAKIDFAEAEIKKTLTQQKLYVFGLDQESISKLENEPHSLYMEYKISAPFDAVVIDKHITRGEVVKPDSPVFTIADLKTVWVDFDVFPKDLPYVKKGQSVAILLRNQNIKAELMFVSPVLNPETRTATARVILDNSEGILYPGQFVTAHLNNKTYSGGIVVPQKAVQMIEGKKCVFVKIGNKYEPRNITLGQSNKDRVEIISGLKEGESVVTGGAFELKSKIVTSTLDSHAGHGH